jgi:hypothetical protein
MSTDMFDDCGGVPVRPDDTSHAPEGATHHACVLCIATRAEPTGVPTEACAGGCANTYKKCAGKGITGVKACCKKTDHCVFKNSGHSECRPKSKPLPSWPAARVQTCGSSSGVNAKAVPGLLLKCICCGSGAASHSCTNYNGHPEVELHEVTCMHVVCENPEKHRIFSQVMAGGDLSLARYTYEELEEAGTYCAKKCAAEAKCVAFQEVYGDDPTASRVEECAHAHVHICTGALHMCENPCCFSLLPVPVLEPHQWCWELQCNGWYCEFQFLKAFQCALLLTAFAYCRCYLFGENLFTTKGSLYPPIHPDYRAIFLAKCFKPKPGA